MSNIPVRTGAPGSVPWARIGVLLLGALLALLVLDQTVDAGARVGGERVQRFDAAALLV